MAVALVAWRLRVRQPATAVLVNAPQPKLSRDFALDDPLSGRRVFTLEPRDPAFDGIKARDSGDAAWVFARPDPAYRYEKKPEERGGVDPCALPAAQQSPFGAWKYVSSKSYFAMPKAKAVRPDGSFDALLIFHGHDMALTELSQVDVPIVLFGTTRGSYRDAYAGPEALGQLLEALESRVSDVAEQPAHAGHIALVAWSGGYDAISILLEQSQASDRVDSVVLLDGLHCSRKPEKMAAMLGPFLAFAKRAAAGKTFMLVTHSSVDTDGFASTTETMHFLANELGGRPLRVKREDPLGLRLIEMFDRGDFHLRGYAGGGKRDHCAHLGLYPEAARVLAKRWAG